MNAFKVTIQFTEKQGFTQEGLRAAIKKNLSDIQLALLDYDYKKDGYTESPEIPLLKKTYSVCDCIIETKNFSPELPYHQIVLGGIQGLPEEYPYFEIHGITPSYVEIK